MVGRAVKTGATEAAAQSAAEATEGVAPLVADRERVAKEAPSAARRGLVVVEAAAEAAGETAECRWPLQSGGKARGA